MSIEYERGVSDAKKAIAAKVRDLAVYFDRFECYSGKYGNSHAAESLSPDQIAELLTEVEIEP
jgi:hypothetical protein